MREPRRPSLFDLPLERPEEEPVEPASGGSSEEPSVERGTPPHPEPGRRPPRPGASRRGAERELPLFPGEAGPGREAPRPPESLREPAPPPETRSREGLDSHRSATRAMERPAPVPASLGARWRAGGLDLALHAALALALAVGSRLLGAPLEGIEMLGLAAFLAVFSFLYTVIPLAFWGRTLGMMRAGLVASGGDGAQGALTFGQTALRWTGGLLTVALLGLPSLLALLGGRSLTDRLSGSRTWRLPRSGDR